MQICHLTLNSKPRPTGLQILRSCWHAISLRMMIRKVGIHTIMLNCFPNIAQVIMDFEQPKTVDFEPR